MPQLLESFQETNALVNTGIGEEEKKVFLDVMRKIHGNLEAGLEESGATVGRSGVELRGRG